MSRERIPFEVVKRIGQLSGDPDDRFRLELRTVKWNGRAEKLRFARVGTRKRRRKTAKRSDSDRGRGREAENLIEQFGR